MKKEKKEKDYFDIHKLRGFVRHIQGTTTFDCPVANDLLGSTDLSNRERRGRLQAYLFDRTFLGLDPNGAYRSYLSGDNEDRIW